MKRLLLLVLVIGVVLFGACAKPVDEPLLSEDEAPAHIWSYLPYNLPDGHTKTKFQADTKTAIYQGNGIWTFTVHGSVSERESEYTLFGELEDMNLENEAIETMKSTLYSTPGDETVQSVYDYCMSGKCRDKEIIERKTTTYQLKLTADFYETQAVFENLAIDQFGERIEAASFLLLPELLPCGCHEALREIRIK